MDAISGETICCVVKEGKLQSFFFAPAKFLSKQNAVKWTSPTIGRTTFNKRYLKQLV
jgi:hypothetical protein